jgi:MFS family permease
MINKTQGLSSVFRALESRNFRLFFAGQGISLIGTWITQVATIWLVYRLTNSALLLGLVGFASQVPTFIVTPFAGIFVDRWNRHRILIITQILSMIQSLTLAFLALSGIIQIWHLIILSIFQGLINAFDGPTRQAFVTEMVEKKENLSNAIALNSSLFNGARLVGPAMAGVLIAAVGSGMCFLIDGVSYIAVIASLLAMKVKPREIPVSNIHPLQRLKEGFVYAFSFPPIRSILMLLAFTSFMGMSYTVLIPIFATEILQGGSETLGFLMGSSGIGALMGGIYLSSRKSILGLGKIVAIAPAIWGGGLIAFSLSNILWISLLTLLIAGFGSILLVASSNTFLQTIVEEDKRGRLMSLFIMSFIGMVPLGNLFAGSLANVIGAPHTLTISGIGCVLGSFIFHRQLPSLRPLIRPIYLKLGILQPES